MTVAKKKIMVVDDHQYTLLVWGKLFLETRKAYQLVSIDYHPDTNPPFWLYAVQKAIAIDPDREEILVPEFQKKVMDAIDPLNLESIEAVMNQMRNDEHINTAMVLGYLKDYHMINCMEKHEYPLGHHYLVNEKDFGSLHDNMFSNVGFSIKALKKEAYILDIDLDYFSSLVNFEYKPRDFSILKQLVQGASLITVARSKTYFDYLKKENFSIAMCEGKLIAWLEEILKANKEDM
ncbi:MAG: UPF0489 family protein [Acetobacterium sp.]